MAVDDGRCIDAVVLEDEEGFVAVELGGQVLQGAVDAVRFCWAEGPLYVLPELVDDGVGVCEVPGPKEPVVGCGIPCLASDGNGWWETNVNAVWWSLVLDEVGEMEIYCW